jgi:hypothetical protein
MCLRERVVLVEACADEPARRIQPLDEKQSHWIKRGPCACASLDFLRLDSAWPENSQEASRDMLSSLRLDGRQGRLQANSANSAFLSCVLTDGRAYLELPASPRGLAKAPPYANPARVE